MGASGGPPETIAIAGREFRYASDANPLVLLGGFQAEYLANGDGSTRKIMTRIPWSIMGNEVESDGDNDDFEFLNDVQDSPDDVDIVITYANGVSYASRGGIEGELSEDNTKATAGFDLKGPGKLKKV